MNANDNIKYAPGFPTYGVKGDTGGKGKDGSSLYYTKYLLSSFISDSAEANAERIEVTKRMNQGLPINNYENSSAKVTYNVGDIVIDGGGSFFRVTEANGRLDLSTEPILSVQNWGANALSGVIPIDVSREVSESVLVRKNDRLILSPTINGMDIIANSVTEEDLKASENVSPNAVQRVIGGVPMQYNGYNIVPMSSFISFDLDGLPTYLTIYYNKSLGTWGIESNSSLVLDLPIYSSRAGSADTRRVDGYEPLEVSSIGMKRFIYNSFFAKEVNLPAKKEVSPEYLMKYIHSGGELGAYVYLNTQKDGKPVESEFVGRIQLRRDDISQMGVSSSTEYVQSIDAVRETIAKKIEGKKDEKPSLVAMYLTILDSVEVVIDYM